MKVRESTIKLIAFGLTALVVAWLIDADWQAVGAIAAMVGALAAWRAAAASERTGREALLALALAVKPTVEASVGNMTVDSPAGPPQRFAARAWNPRA